MEAIICERSGVLKERLWQEFSLQFSVIEIGNKSRFGVINYGQEPLDLQQSVISFLSRIQ